MMSRGRAIEPDKILIEFWRYMGIACFLWLNELFNVIFKTKEILEECSGV